MTQNNDLPDDPNHSWPVEILHFLRARLISVILVIAGFIALLAYFFAGWSPPRLLRVVLAAALAATPFWALAGFYARGKLTSTDWYYLLDLDALDQDFAMYRMPQRYIAEFEVVDGQLDNPAPTVYIGKDVDLDARTVKGTWRGTLTDRELLASLQAVREVRGQLEEDARKGFALQNNLYAIVRSAVANNVRTIVETFEKGTLPDEGDSMGAAVDEAIGDFGADNSNSVLKDGDLDLDDLDLDDLSELAEFQAADTGNANGDDFDGTNSDPLNYQGGADD